MFAILNFSSNHGAFLFFLSIHFDPAPKLLLPLNVDFSASISAFFSISVQTQHTYTSPHAQPQELLLRRTLVPKKSDNPGSTFSLSNVGRLLHSLLLHTASNLRLTIA